MTDYGWPGGIAPRHVAAEIMDTLRLRTRPLTAAEKHAIIDEVIALHPGCAADIVRGHIEAVKVRLRHGKARRINGLPISVTTVVSE